MSSESSVLRVCSFESRRRDEMKSLIRRHGGEPTVAPSMREVPLVENPQALRFAEQLMAGQIDIVLFLTGVGARALLEAASTRFPGEDILDGLRRVQTIVRGPKPTAVLREWNVPITLRAPEPNTWRDIVAVIDAEQLSVEGKIIAVQEYGEPADELCAALRERGTTVMPVPVYRWALPDDIGPLRAAVESTIASEFDVLLFTSAQQVRHVVSVAEEQGGLNDWTDAARLCVIGSIGPTCSQTLRDAGLPVDLEPSHPKMGPLVREVLAAAPALLAAKRPS